MIFSKFFKFLFLSVFTYLQTFVWAQTQKDGYEQRRREGMDNVIGAAHIMEDLLLVGVTGSSASLEAYKKIKNTNDRIKKNQLAGEHLRKIEETSESILNLKNRLNEIPLNPDLSESEKAKQALEINRSIDSEVDSLKKSVAKIEVPSIRKSFSEILGMGNLKVTEKSLNLLKNNAREKLGIIQGNLWTVYDQKLDSNKRLKALKYANILAGVLFVTDSSGQMWAWAKDEPAPTPIPGIVAFDILAVGGTSLYEKMNEMAASYMKNKKLSEKDRGTPEELLNEGTEPKKDSGSNPPKKH